MRSLSQTELVYLQAVERKGAHTLAPQQREAAIESLRAQGLVEDEGNIRGFQLVSITDAGRRVLQAECQPLTWREERDSLLAATFRHHEGPVRVLDVGGGRKCNFTLPDHRHVAVCDIDAAALASNEVADERIECDIAHLNFGDRQFDLIVFWHVLEHIDCPMRALSRMSRALAPGGAVLIKGPIVSSLQGLVTKYSPHFLRVAYYRYFLGHANAGRPGFCPHRTTRPPAPDDRAIVITLRDEGFEILAHRRFSGPHVEWLKSKSRLAYAAFRGLSALISAAAEQDAGGEQSDFFILARRPS